MSNTTHAVRSGQARLSISAYAVAVAALATDYDRILRSCRRQGIGRVAIAASMTGKLMGAPEALLAARRRLESDGIGVYALVYGIGHPAMAKYYQGLPQPPDPLPYYDGDGVAATWRDAEPLPRGWNYAVNEFGNPVFCCACPDAACVEGNRGIMRALAPIFDEIWYDDDFRVDGDQGAGTPTGSTASCYCDRCLEALGNRIGRPVQREAVLIDPVLHEAWTEQKLDRLTGLWQAVCETGREVNPQLKMGLMIRWGGEERDGVDVNRLLPEFRGDFRLRAGEGHFGADEYLRPESQVQAHLSVSHHVGWFPGEAEVLSETTYFDGMRREDILKKVALALAAGAREIAYCPCVTDWICHQDYLEPHVPEMARWREAFGDHASLHDPIVILRSPAAGRGDCDPVKRARDRQIFPLFSLAGLCAAVRRIPGTGLPRQASVAAVTGRTVWDVTPAMLADRPWVADGHALLENAPLNTWLGVADIRRGAGGRVDFRSNGWTRDGLLLTRPGATLIPYCWQDVPQTLLPALLADIRRVLAPAVGSASLSGDFNVFVAHSRHADFDALLLVNLTREPRRVALRLPGTRQTLSRWDGEPASLECTLAPDEIRLLRVTVVSLPRRGALSFSDPTRQGVEP